MTPEPEEKIEERDTDHGTSFPKPVVKIEADENDHGDTKRIVPAAKTIVFSSDDHS